MLYQLLLGLEMKIKAMTFEQILEICINVAGVQLLTIIKLPEGIPLCPKFVQSNQATTTRLAINQLQNSLGRDPNRLVGSNQTDNLSKKSRVNILWMHSMLILLFPE